MKLRLSRGLRGKIMFNYLMQLLALSKQNHASIEKLTLAVTSIEEKIHTVNLDKTNALLQEILDAVQTAHPQDLSQQILDELKSIKKCVCGEEIVGLGVTFDDPKPRE